MPNDKSIASGNMSMLLLKLLSEKDMYGYEMIQTLRDRSENVFELKAGTLYPLLHTLEDKHLLESYEDLVQGRTRVFYRITKEGRKALEDKTKEWEQYSHAISNILAFGV